MLIRPMFRLVRIKSAGRNLLRDQCGSTAVTVALLLSVLMGFVGLGVDVGHSYLTHRSLQSAADSSAFSAAASLAAGGGTTVEEAQAVAGRYGLTSGENGVLITVNTPPATGPNAGNSRAIEVLIERPGRRFFSHLFLANDGMVRARAVARISPAANACVVALNSTAEASTTETGSANISLNGCSLFSNSSGASALALKGSAQLSADSVGVVGGYTVGSNASLTTVSGAHAGQRSIEDPYKDMPVPPYSGCNYNSASLATGTYGGGSAPTVFCNGLQLNSGVTVTLNPGIYVIDRGTLKINGGATLRGEGVTIVLTSSTGTDYATAQFAGKSTVELAAPDSGPTAGVAIYQDRLAPAGGNNVLSGGSTQSLLGAVYFPSQMLTFTGGSSTSSGCTQLVAGQIAFRGDSNVAMSCSGIPIRRVHAIHLVE